MGVRNTDNQLYSTVPTERHIKSFYDDGKIDLREVVNFLHFSNDDIAKISGVAKSSIRYDEERVPKSIQSHLQEIANIYEIVANNFGGDLVKTVLWFKIENPMLGNISPRDMIRIGNHKRLQKFIFAAINGDLP